MRDNPTPKKKQRSAKPVPEAAKSRPEVEVTPHTHPSMFFRRWAKVLRFLHQRSQRRSLWLVLRRKESMFPMNRSLMFHVGHYIFSARGPIIILWFLQSLMSL
jgi:hypothetical protein